MSTLLGEFGAQIAELPANVRRWMNWMLAVFLSSAFFAPSHSEARWALAAYFVSIAVGLVLFSRNRSIHLSGLPQLLFWFPLLVYLLLAFTAEPKFEPWGLLRIWHHLLSATIVTALLFDARDLYLVHTGAK